MKKILLLAILATLLISCNTIPKDLQDEDVTPEEFFQKAQEAVIDWNKYKAAILYYEEFMRRFPDMKNKIIEAEYEIAFIKYKQRKLDESEVLLNNLLDKYQTDEAVYYPVWPAIMANKTLENIAEEREKGGFWKRLFNKKTAREKAADEKLKEQKRAAKAEKKAKKEARKAAKRAAKAKRDV